MLRTKHKVKGERSHTDKRIWMALVFSRQHRVNWPIAANLNFSCPAIKQLSRWFALVVVSAVLCMLKCLCPLAQPQGLSTWVLHPSSRVFCSKILQNTLNKKTFIRYMISNYNLILRIILHFLFFDAQTLLTFIKSNLPFPFVHSQNHGRSPWCDEGSALLWSFFPFSRLCIWRDSL